MKVEDIRKEDIESIECKHVVYGTSSNDGNNYRDDMILIKEKIHLKNKTSVVNRRIIKNPERPYWVTKPIYRNHEEKKTREFLDKVDMRMSTQAGLITNVKRSLDIIAPYKTLKQVARVPYSYGLDLPVTSYYKKKYMNQYPDSFTENDVAALDIETDVVDYNGTRRYTEEPILLQLTFKNRAILIATELYLKLTPLDEKTGKPTPPIPKSKYIADCLDYIPKRLKETFDILKTKLEVHVVKTPLDAIKLLFERAHEWSPDIIAIWNIDFDLPIILETIKKYGGDIGDIFSDPKVPPEFRNAWYHKGQVVKRTQSGDETPLHWVDQWHTMRCLAGFYFIDQACAFRKIRFAGGNEPSWALASILKKYTSFTKLNERNEITKDMTALQWHQYMQVHEKIEYSAYAIADGQGCELLDMEPKVKDLAVSISTQCRHSDYDKFPSQPKRSVENMHYTCLENNMVLGSTSDKLYVDKFDDKSVGINDWIVTLAAHLILSTGIKCLIDVPTMATLLWIAVYDQ